MYEPVLLETDGAETDFDFDFSVFDDTDLVVALIDPDTLEVLDEPELGVDYTVMLNTSTVGGTVVFGTAPADGQLVSIRRDIPTTQGTDIPSGGLFRESQIENALDKMVLLIQQLEERVDRTLLQNPYQTTTELALPVAEADTVLGWNTAGDALENKAPNTEAYLTKASQALAEAGTDDANYMTPLKTKQAIDAQVPDLIAAYKVRVGTGTIVTGELDIDASLYDVVNVTVDDDFELQLPTNGDDGDRIEIRLTQDDSGNHVITLASGFQLASELAEDGIVLSTAASALDKLGLSRVGSVWMIDAFTTDYAEEA